MGGRNSVSPDALPPPPGAGPGARVIRVGMEPNYPGPRGCGFSRDRGLSGKQVAVKACVDAMCLRPEPPGYRGPTDSRFASRGARPAEPVSIASLQQICAGRAIFYKYMAASCWYNPCAVTMSFSEPGDQPWKPRSPKSCEPRAPSLKQRGLDFHVEIEAITH